MANAKGAGIAFIVILMLYFFGFSQIFKGDLSGQTGLVAIAFGFILAFIGAAVIAAKA